MAANKAEEYLNAYAEHSKTLRTWLVAYGIGAPVLLDGSQPLTDDQVYEVAGRVAVLRTIVRRFGGT